MGHPPRIPRICELAGDFARLHEGKHTSPAAYLGSARWRPAVDLMETEHGWILWFEVPGVGTDSLELVLESQPTRLVLRGRRRRSSESAGRLIHLEIFEGDFERIVEWTGPDFGPESVEALLMDGVLRVTIHPTKHESQTPSQRRIAIQSPI